MNFSNLNRGSFSQDPHITEPEHFTGAEILGMETALSAARQGVRGANPLVGAVIIDADGTFLAIGHHRGAGTAHAETDVINRLLGTGVKRDLSAATLIVTLEPCNHVGLTGPCSQAILDAGIGNVVFALRDPHQPASGGADVLHKEGINVRMGLMAAEAEDLNRQWFVAVRQNRPFITARLAQTVDGRIAAIDGTSQWITSQESRQDSHELRARVDAIVVGTETVIADNPRLTARAADDTDAAKQPLRVVMGMREVPEDAAVRGRATASADSASRVSTHQKTSAELKAGDNLKTGPDFLGHEGFLALHTHDPAAVVRELQERGVGHLMIEGGAKINAAFLARGLVDELIVYLAPTLLGSGIPALSDLGIGTLGEAQRWEWDATTTGPVQVLGPDLKLTLMPAKAAASDEGM
ncbi:bifunctional diaminohydroxyphosphoribosylaminopyrimidine deaminase/5-amino-6-(5-phosphoribosylamino)uracil reductase RibD [Arthrobacter antibioticus]|uniref:bifunctional diaminohydroxyphosphoribosylaminopyrimidine deaminase/5-amino-6-(5-phosphoribosylamino)uracil reductase RibD n=1 Tax=Arthrobacter sp. H35-MC1 TaxID=3046203 RepID=UPI0024B8D272|nr:bifunctional diaminohydroxyphosphoribosylaminopyrimidine deaminase/5-amino-6-(5-phosphoribosylamino)uracil reductase RibD [Arthrobacter sp. H35-MC1]MDJ0318071.1 bifunctional diaminohydroxyphosphoribosylaminopyrimidine deaminase/5-amino-6-(5-phosphoribosylamino)uracil reductase RibD [Arthrobacter sp. H35-MC1]